MPYLDPAKSRACRDAYHEKNKHDEGYKTKLAEAQRKYRAKDPWMTSMRDRANVANQRAKRYGVEGRLTVGDVIALFEKYSCCGFCDKCDDLVMDHVKPLAVGGENKPENLGVLCKRCNDLKGGMYIEYRPGYEPAVGPNDKTFTVVIAG